VKKDYVVSISTELDGKTITQLVMKGWVDRTFFINFLGDSLLWQSRTK
jgi:hypothetical protein